MTNGKISKPKDVGVKRKEPWLRPWQLLRVTCGAHLAKAPSRVILQEDSQGQTHHQCAQHGRCHRVSRKPVVYSIAFFRPNKIGNFEALPCHQHLTGDGTSEAPKTVDRGCTPSHYEPTMGHGAIRKYWKCSAHACASLADHHLSKLFSQRSEQIRPPLGRRICGPNATTSCSSWTPIQAPGGKRPCRLHCCLSAVAVKELQR